MRIVGIDFGERRIGVAAADTSTRMAIPVTTVEVHGDPIEELVLIADDQRAEELVFGLPLSLTGAEGPQAQRIRDVAAELEQRISIPIRFHDERLTSRQADFSAGPKQPKTKKKGVSRAKASSPGRDAVAASILLQAYLDSQRPYD